MAKIKIVVKDNRAALLGSIDLIAGTVGQVCTFYFDDEWKSLNKKVTYKVGPNILGTYEMKTNEITVPKQVLMTAGLPLEIGITGYSSDKTTITPTSWCLIGNIKPGTTVCHGNESEDDSDGKHVIYDGGVVVYEQNESKHLIYDGGVIA